MEGTLILALLPHFQCSFFGRQHCIKGSRFVQK